MKKKNQTKGEKSRNVVSEYLRQLDRDLFEKLIKIYKTDFHIFGYSIPDFSAL